MKRKPLTKFSTHIGKEKVKLTQFADDMILYISSFQFISVAQSCPTLCNSMNHSTPGLPVHHQLPDFARSQREEFHL